MLDFLKAANPWITIALSIAVLAVTIVKNKKRKQEGKEADHSYMSEGMCTGLCIGMLIGSEWMSFGMLIGLAIGASIKKK